MTVTPLRAYHLLSAHHAISNLRHRRLKIARLDDLNDPFDLWSLAQPSRELRMALRLYRKEVSQHLGMVCFSLSWWNPLLWSHYGDRHHGIALGFDLNPKKCQRVEYISERPTLQKVDLQISQQLLFTKFIDWQYEEEVRMFVNIHDIDPETQLYFADFGNDCQLREVIVGPLCDLTAPQLSEALGDTNYAGVTVTKARLAFNSFRIVTDQRGFSG